MASIRRTLSPYNGRHLAPVNSVLPPPAQLYSHSHKLFPRASQSLPPPYTKTHCHRQLVSLILHLHGRLSSSRSSLRKSSYSCLLLFLAGFLLGLFPFWNFDDLRPNVLDVEIKHPNATARLVDVPDSPRLWSNMDSMQEGERRPGSGESFDFVAPRKQLIIITPTYNRAMQGYFLNKVGQVLRLVPPPVMWIVVEMNEASMETAEILRHSGVMYRHLMSRKNLTDVKDRDVHPRNAALEHIEGHRLDGIVYFADDDNVYTPKLFDRLREISRFGTWPVAMLARGKNKAVFEGPVCNGTQVIGWNTNEKSKRLRRFQVDMSGFAFNSTILWDPNRWGNHPLHPIWQLDMVKERLKETTFIEQVVENELQMEGIPYGCSKILNWHLHLDAHKISYPKGWLFTENLNSNLPVTS